MSSLPKVSVVTTVLNGREFIADTIESVLAQSYPNIEHVVKDGGSTDGTLEVLARYAGKIKLVSKKDSGIYDGMNQALAEATGDIVAILNSDDMYAGPGSVAAMVGAMTSLGADTAWSDLVYVDRKDASRVVRKWRSSAYTPGKFQKGWHPPHPTFFVRRGLYEKYGYFRTDMRVSADYELMLRFLEKYRVSGVYVPEVTVKMRSGGTSGSNLARLYKMRREDHEAWRVNSLKGGFLASFFLKPLSKIRQFF